MMWLLKLQSDTVCPADLSDMWLVIPSGQDITIDLNGHSIKRNLSSPVNDGWVIKVEAGGVLTVNGGSITGNSVVAYQGGGIYNVGTLNLKGGTVTGETFAQFHGFFFVDE